MCGIVGFAEEHHDPAEARRILQGMAALIRHRGPDGEGLYADDRAALGHRRLSIIDLEGGGQPMFNEDGSLVVVFNGEIYNYRELARQLSAAGHTFATRSDTEVLLHGWEQWGRALPGKLRGMFAFVLWDRTTGTLFGARDLFGIKPLYYYRRGELLLFASEIKAFLAHPGFVKRFNEDRLPDYLSSRVPARGRHPLHRRLGAAAGALLHLAGRAADAGAVRQDPLPHPGGPQPGGMGGAHRQGLHRQRGSPQGGRCGGGVFSLRRGGFQP